MSAVPPVSEQDLHGFVDDELDAGRRQEVARLVRDDPKLAARVAAYAEDRDRLRTALGGLDMPVPAAWLRQIQAATETAARLAPSGRKRAGWLLTRRTAIAASLALMVGGVGVTALEWPRGDTILADARAARDGAGKPAGGMAGARLADAALRDGLLRSTLGMQVRAPDLRRFGFILARLDVFGRAAQLRYGDAGGRVLTIYVRPSSGAVRFDLLKHGATRICVWQDDVVGAVIMAPVSAGEMLRIASGAYGDLNL